jgi:ABC-type phosphate transport system permease subunit
VQLLPSSPPPWLVAPSPEVRRKASRIGRLVGIGTTLPMAVYVTLTFPAERTARLVGAACVLLWYVLTFTIARRVAVEWLK